MRIGLTLLIVLALAGATSAQEPAGRLPHRWFTSNAEIKSATEYSRMAGLINAAATHGYNGVVLATGMQRFDSNDPDTVAALRQIKTLCDERGVEIIPYVPGVGWGGALWQRAPNLIAGLPVKDTLLVVRDGTAVHVPDSPLGIRYGDFEGAPDDVLAAFTADAPNRCTFVDEMVARSGQASLRMENVGAATRGWRMCRIGQEVEVRPQRCYRFRPWMRTEGLRSAKALRLYAWKADLNWPPLPFRWIAAPSETSDWKSVGYLLNSWDQERVFAYAGMWGAQADDPGVLWIDDFNLEEAGPDVAVRRPGTPVVIRREDDGRELVDGKDYHFPIDPKPSHWSPNYRGPEITILPGGPAGLKEGDRLRADWYQPVVGASTHMCMSEPRLYEVYGEWFQEIHDAIAPSTYLLSMDEVRGGLTCALCKSRGLTNGEILADCVNRLVEEVRTVDPEAQVVVWGDMFDPRMNAKEGDFWWVPGGFPKSWETLSRDVIIAAWSALPVEADKIRASLDHFSSLGFRTIGGAYYDDDDLEGSRTWLEELGETPGAEGIIYCTWTGQGRYDLLPAFGDMLNEDD